jgi:Domain of unknown function (DUF3291)
VARLAFLTFGLMRAPTGDPAVRGFEIRIAATYERAAESHGFLGSFAEESGSGGLAVRPERWAAPAYAARSAITMTLWTDLESVRAFAFGPSHSGVLRRGHAWREHGDWPRHVAWWVADDEVPTPAEACRRYDLLDELGPAPDAFTFEVPYDADGAPVDLDRIEQLRRR